MPLSVPRSAGRDRKWHLDAVGGGRSRAPGRPAPGLRGGPSSCWRLSDRDVREPRRSGHSPACASPARSRRRRCPPRTCCRPANVSSGHRCAACSARWSAKPQPNSTSWMATTPSRDRTRPSAPPPPTSRSPSRHSRVAPRESSERGRRGGCCRRGDERCNGDHRDGRCDDPRTVLSQRHDFFSVARISSASRTVTVLNAVNAAAVGPLPERRRSAHRGLVDDRGVIAAEVEQPGRGIPVHSPDAVGVGLHRRAIGRATGGRFEQHEVLGIDRVEGDRLG